jgi:hypothetical protein
VPGQIDIPKAIVLELVEEVEHEHWDAKSSYTDGSHLSAIGHSALAFP